MKPWILEFWHFRELFWALTLREIKIRYKQTVLGAAWAILQPAALTVIFTIVFGIFLKVTSGPVPYPIFAYSALLPWTFFSTAVSFGALSVVNNANLVTKIYFSREILPLASVAAAFFDFITASAIFILMFIFYRVPLNLNMFFLLIIIPAIFLLTTGISLILACLNVLFRDVRFVIPIVLQIWFYITPIIYSLDQVPAKFRIFYPVNPMAPLIESFRTVTILGKSPDLPQLSLAALNSILVFILGYWFFKSKEKIFADVI